MNPQLPPLIALQALDLRIVEIREQRRRIPDLLDTTERPLREANQRLQNATATSEKTAKSRRDREQELETQETQIQKLKSRVSEIKKNVEYQAHLFEIQMATKKKGEIEEQVLLLMEEGEKVQRLVQKATVQVGEAERGFTGKKTELQALDEKLAAELAELETKQQAVAQSLDKALLDRYNKLKKTRKDLAVTPLRDGICSGCRLQLPPQFAAEVRRSHDLLSCSYCHRILYWEGEPGQPTETPSEPETTPVENQLGIR